MSQHHPRVDVGATARPRRSILSIGALSLAGFATIWACGGGGGDTPPITPPPAQTPTIAISNSASISGQQGTTQTSTITLTRGGNYTGAVTLAASGAPTGVTVTLTPSTLSGTTTTSTLSAVIAGTAAATTTGSITVTASGSGVSSATTSVPVTVTAAPSPDFTLSPSTANATVVQGQSSAATAFTLARLNGYAGEVALAASGLPTGVTAAVLQPGAGSAGSVVFTALTTAGTGTYPITLTATGPNVSFKTAVITLVVQATPTVVLGLTPPSLSLAQGASGQTAIAITRTNITGDVTLTAENVPQGVTATFTPSATSGTTSSLSLVVGGAVTPGVYTITVRGSAAGATAGTAAVTLTVTAAQSYSLSATSASVQQGNTGTSTVSITRSGGFAGAVTLAASNLPNGVTPSFSPNNTSGNSSTLTLTATGSATPGTYTVTLTGTATGLANVTTTLSVTVTASGGGSGNVNWTFCEAARFPLWFAVQNGTSGSWTRVTPTGSINRVYTFTINTRGGVAYAIPRSGGGTDVTVQYLSEAEIVSGGTSECVSNRATKTLTGTVANLPVGTFGYVGIGGAQASVTGPSTSYTIENVDDGTTDLAAIRTTLSGFSLVPDRGVLRRGINYPSGGSVPVVDFTGSESFAIASADYTVSNAGSDQVVTTASIITANGVAGIFSFPTLTGGSQKVYGVPFARTVSGDLHQVLVIGFSGSGLNTSTRAVAQYNRELINRTITLGPTLSTPTVTSLGSSPYVRFSIGGPWQSEYADAIGVGFTQQTTGSNSWTISASRTYVGTGAGTWSLAIPDFSGVAGFSGAWALSSASTNWSLSAISGTLAGGAGNGALGFSENGSFRFAARTGTISP